MKDKVKEAIRKVESAGYRVCKDESYRSDNKYAKFNIDAVLSKNDKLSVKVGGKSYIKSGISLDSFKKLLKAAGYPYSAAYDMPVKLPGATASKFLKNFDKKDLQEAVFKGQEVICPECGSKNVEVTLGSLCRCKDCGYESNCDDFVTSAKGESQDDGFEIIGPKSKNKYVLYKNDKSVDFTLGGVLIVSTSGVTPEVVDDTISHEAVELKRLNLSKNKDFINFLK